MIDLRKIFKINQVITIKNNNWTITEVYPNFIIAKHNNNRESFSLGDLVQYKLLPENLYN